VVLAHIVDLAVEDDPATLWRVVLCDFDGKKLVGEDKEAVTEHCMWGWFAQRPLTFTVIHRRRVC